MECFWGVRLAAVVCRMGEGMPYIYIWLDVQRTFLFLIFLFFMQGYDGLGVCLCTTGFIGANCSQQCPVDQATNQTCAGHGRCNTITALCMCQANYYGESLFQTEAAHLGWVGELFQHELGAGVPHPFRPHHHHATHPRPSLPSSLSLFYRRRLRGGVRAQRGPGLWGAQPRAVRRRCHGHRGLRLSAGLPWVHLRAHLPRGRGQPLLRCHPLLPSRKPPFPSLLPPFSFFFHI